MAGAITIDAADDIRTTTNGPVDLYKQSAAKVLLNYNGIANTVRHSVNVSSVVDNGSGDYTANTSSAFTNSNYTALTNSVLNAQQAGVETGSWETSALATSYRFKVRSSSGTQVDYAHVTTTIHGDLA